VQRRTRSLEWTVAPEELDRAIAILWLAGSLGMRTLEEQRGTRLTAWFPEPIVLPQDRPGWPVPSARLLADRWEPAVDWQAEYRRTSRPFALGSRFWVDPGEPDRPVDAVPKGRALLRLPARAAFGTGSHASTALVIELMEAAPPVGLRVLDVGCGTGVLCFAALQLGAARAIGFDVQVEAAATAWENRRLNRSRAGFFAGQVAALTPAARFDLVLANVLPSEIAPELDDVLVHVDVAGSVILSGLLRNQEEEVTRRLRDRRFEPIAARHSGEWVALRLARHEP
jgi:ribosomal protein L11 methyltransferase